MASLPTYQLDRLSRYEQTLWRQVAELLVASTTSTPKAARKTIVVDGTVVPAKSGMRIDVALMAVQKTALLQFEAALALS